MDGAVDPSLGDPPAGTRPRRRGRAVPAAAAAAAAAVEGGAAGVANSAGRGRCSRAGLGGRGRGGGRKRARELEPPPLPAPEHPDSESDRDSSKQSGSEHTASGDDDRQQNAAGDGQAPAAALPQALSKREVAIQLLMQTTGVSRDRAVVAIDETRGNEEPQDPVDWGDKAQIWLAESADIEAERDEMAAMMRVSLEEAEQRKAQKKPLAEQSVEEIQQEFATSELLLRLAERRCLESLLQQPLRKPLLDYLALERDCKKWYGVSCHFFKATAAQLANQLDGDTCLDGACCNGEVAGAAAASTLAACEPPPSKRRRLDGALSQAGTAAGARSSVHPRLPPIDEDAAAVLAVELDCQRQEIQDAVFAMPQGGGLQVPALFAVAVPEGAEPECVELLDSEDDEEPDTSQQQQQPPPQQQQPEGDHSKGAGHN